jgi:alanine racemase
MRPIQASLSLAALRGNIAVVRRHAPASRVWAVVKADAYGHGLMRLLPALRDADGLALLELDMAARLREQGVLAPVLMLEGFFDADELPAFSRLGLTAVLHSEAQLAALEQARLAAPIDVYAKFNTGMNRLGLAPASLPSVLQRLRACSNVAGIHFMTHFADADGARGVEAAMQVVAACSTPLQGLPRSLANSAAVLRFPETHADWVRPGIMLYGCTPFGDDVAGHPASRYDLRPVMTLASRIIAVQALKAGDRVGYGGSFAASGDMRIGVVACGYADGYPRHAPGAMGHATPILVGGQRTHTVGRVSMDMLFADITQLPDAGVGTPVTLWGEGLSADEVASAAGTVSYELLCALTGRVPVKVVD